jgi:ATP-dependent Zn protease
VALLGNILFPLIAFGGLFFLFRRAQGGSGGGGPMGPMGGPMEFGRSKSKFQEVPETGVTFADVAVSTEIVCFLVYLRLASCGSWVLIGRVCASQANSTAAITN